MILASQFGEFFTIAIIAIFIIAIALVVYYIVTGKKKNDEEIKISPNFETKNIANPVSPQNNHIINNNGTQNIEKEEVILEQAQEVPVQEKIPEPVKESTDDQKALEEAKTDSSIQKLLNQMQQDLDNPTNDSYAESIARYEDDEEANAIISYKELMKYKENREKNIVLEDKDKEEIKEVIKEKEVEEPKEEVKKFKRSEFISPIFGYNEDTNVTYREIKRPPRKEITRNIESNEEWESDRMLKNLENDAAEVIEFEDEKEETKEFDKNDSFLDALVDFRNKLN